ncbi:hypothetical protein B0T22DRAFT_436566 [Podospora appendiculata]|uniref:Uncharacterized protein n=1 Tax=Podospora appendiculata TaxID=314037 RepID=A0AAE0XHA0_9PEZI|nr:hypothetical protein B0T22DRAFT_436566 [Podospora appendiculata]
MFARKRKHVDISDDDDEDSDDERREAGTLVAYPGGPNSKVAARDPRTLPNPQELVIPITNNNLNHWDQVVLQARRELRCVPYHVPETPVYPRVPQLRPRGLPLRVAVATFTPRRLNAFQNFPHLPMEVRHKIWGMTVEPFTFTTGYFITLRANVGELLARRPYAIGQLDYTGLPRSRAMGSPIPRRESRTTACFQVLRRTFGNIERLTISARLVDHCAAVPELPNYDERTPETYDWMRLTLMDALENLSTVPLESSIPFRDTNRAPIPRLKNLCIATTESPRAAYHCSAGWLADHGGEHGDREHACPVRPRTASRPWLDDEDDDEDQDDDDEGG